MRNTVIKAVCDLKGDRSPNFEDVSIQKTSQIINFDTNFVKIGQELRKIRLFINF